MSDWYRYVSGKIGFLRRSYESYHREHPSSDEGWWAYKSYVAAGLFLYEWGVYQERLKPQLPSSLRVGLDHWLTKFWLTWEVSQLAIRKVTSLYGYLRHLWGYGEIDNVERTLEASRDEEWALVTKSRGSGTVSVFVQREEVILVHPHAVSNHPPDITRSLNPAIIRELYERETVDSKQQELIRRLPEDPLIEYFNRDIAYLIYSFVDEWLVSDTNGLERLVVAHNDDSLKYLHSAMMLGVILSCVESIENERNNAIPEKKNQLSREKPVESFNRYLADVDYQYLLEETLQEKKWYLTGLEGFWGTLSNSRDGHDGLRGDALSFRGRVNDKLGELISGEYSDHDINLRLLDWSRQFYYKLWVQTPLEAPHKSDLARVIGQLEAVYWYLKTMYGYPLNVIGKGVNYDPNSVEFHSDNREFTLDVLRHKQYDESAWLMKEIRVFHLRDDLNVCVTKTYYRDYFRDKESRWTSKGYHTVNTKDEFMCYEHQMRYSVCVSNPCTHDLVTGWLTQYSGYILFKYLCGGCFVPDSARWLMTLQGEICWQRFALNHRWDEWCRDKIKGPWELSRWQGRGQEQDHDEVNTYITEALQILRWRMPLFSFFAYNMTVEDCTEILRAVTSPSHLAIMRGFETASYLYQVESLAPEKDMTEKCRQNYIRKIKSVFDKVRHYHFPESYKRDDPEINQDTIVYEGKQCGSFLDGRILEVNDTDKDTYNDFGGILKSGRARSDWERLLSDLEEPQNSLLGSSEARDFLVKSLAYECFRHSLTAHVCFVIGRRMERGDTPHIRMSEVLLNSRVVGRELNPYYTDPDNFCPSYNSFKPLADLHTLLSEVDHMEGFEVTVNHLDTTETTEETESWYTATQYDNTSDFLPE